MTNRTEPEDRRIIVGADGSALSYQAVAWAAVDAGLRGTRLHILTAKTAPATHWSGVVMGPEEIDWLRSDGERILAEATRIARHAAGDEVQISTELVFEPIIRTLLDRSAHAELMVVGSRGHGALRRGLLGSVSTAVTHHARCPVAVVHDYPAVDPVSLSKPVLVGVDGTENSVPAVELAFEEASRRKVDLIALHTWIDAGSDDLLVSGGWDGVREHEEAVLAESLAGRQEEYPDVAVRRVVRCNRPARSLLDESPQAQLVVVGSHGRGGFTGMLLGSTARSLLHSVECPMIIVRPR